MKKFLHFIKPLTALFALAILAVASLSATPPKRLLTDEPRGHFGVGVVSFTGLQSYSQGYWGTLDGDYGQIEKQFSGNAYGAGQDFDLQGGAVRDNILYLPTINDNMISVEIAWKRVDLATGRELTPISFGMEWNAYGYSITYDPSRDLFHLLAFDYDTGSYGYYTTVDPKTWNFQCYGPFNVAAFLGAISYDPRDNSIWVFGSDSKAYTIDQSRHTLVEMGEFDKSYALIKNQATTACTFSPLDNSFVFFWSDAQAKECRLAYLDLETFSIDLGPKLYPDNPYIGYIHCFDKYAPIEAPEIPTFSKIDLPGESLTATIGFKVPRETISAENIRSDVRMVLKDNGDTILDEKMKAGASWSGEFNLSEGLHKLTLTAEADGYLSAEAEAEVYAGNDTPLAPADLRLDLNTLSWKAVGNVGANKGFVAAEEATYDVYVDGKKENSQPLSATSFTLSEDRPLGRHTIAVTATVRNRESEKTEIREVFGQALQLPWNLAPSQEEADYFVGVNANNDNSAFQFAYDYDRDKEIFFIWLDLNAAADDWLFLPKSHFEHIAKLYNLRFTLRSAAFYEGTEGVEIWLGSAPDPKSMKEKIQDYPSLDCLSDVDMNIMFPVQEPGDYVIGIRCKTAAGQGNGIQLFDFSLSETESSTSVPKSPKVTLTPADLGELKAIVNLTAPVEDLINQILPADEELSFNIEEKGHPENAITLKALPGKQVSGELTISRSGMATVLVTPRSSEGPGLESSHNVYVGTDRPTAPRNVRIQAAEDNLSLTITWDAPSPRGVNGGYVDPEEVEYLIYTAASATQNHITTLPADARSYTYTPATTTLDNLTLGVSARNSVGESRDNIFLADIIGTPIPVPVTEKFSQAGFVLNPLTYNMDGEYANTSWQNIGSLMSMGTGASRDLDLGGLTVFNTGSHDARGQLKLPKFSTNGSPATNFTLRWLDWAHAPIFSIVARTADDEDFELLETLYPEKPLAGEWINSVISLPEKYNNRKWIEIRIECDFSSDVEEYGFIDAVTLTADVARDLKIGTITAPENLTVGFTSEVSVSLLNAGREIANGGLSVKMTDAEGNLIQSEYTPVSNLASQAEQLFRFNVEALREYLDGGVLVITATADMDSDNIPENNEAQKRINIHASQAPAIGDLAAVLAEDEQSVALTWSEPDLTYGDSDDFELMPAFANSEELGLWLNYDLDKEYPFRINGLNWPNNNEPIAWQPIDAAQLGVLSDPRLGPHSGNMYLMARSISFDENDEEDAPVQSNDWLISPEIIGGTQLEFWYGTIDTTLTEFIELWTSSTTRDLDSFSYVRTFSKSGDESWENVRYTLPKNAKYFALVYRSYDGFAAMIDDISFTPAELQSWQVSHYSILRTLPGKDEVQIDQTDEPGYVDTSINGNSATYRVKTAVLTQDGFRDGPASNRASVVASGIDDMKVLEGITGAKGQILVSGHEGETLSLYSADGKHLAQMDVTSPRQSFPCEAGIYIVKARNAYAKIIVR